MTQYIQVTDEEGDEPIELPLEQDDSLLLSTLQGTFPDASGLAFRNPDTGKLRALRLSDGAIFGPIGGWESDTVYVITTPQKENKRKGDDMQVDSLSAKSKKAHVERRTTDLIVLGLPWKITEDEVRKYFSTFGELLMVQLKTDPQTGNSRGYGFIRFAEYSAQEDARSQKHVINGRFCDVKIPDSQITTYQSNINPQSHIISKKIFVGRITEDITAETLKEYFSQFGEVLDVFVPQPFRSFAFVTFDDPAVASSLFGEDHVIQGRSVHIGTAEPKQSRQQQQQQHQAPGMHPHHPQHAQQQNMDPYGSWYGQQQPMGGYGNYSNQMGSGGGGQMQQSMGGRGGMSGQRRGMNMGGGMQDYGGGMQPGGMGYGNTGNMGGGMGTPQASSGGGTGGPMMGQQATHPGSVNPNDQAMYNNMSMLQNLQFNPALVAGLQALSNPQLATQLMHLAAGGGSQGNTGQGQQPQVGAPQSNAVSGAPDSAMGPPPPPPGSYAAPVGTVAAVTSAGWNSKQGAATGSQADGSAGQQQAASGASGWGGARQW